MLQRAMKIDPKVLRINIIGYPWVGYNYRIDIVMAGGYTSKVVKVGVATSIAQKFEFTLVIHTQRIKFVI